MNNQQEKALIDKEIAIVGVSSRPEKFGYKLFKDLLEQGYKVKGINVRGGIVLGHKIYRSLDELENPPDLVITVVPSQVTEKIVEDAKKIGIKEIWMQPGSESENAINKAKGYGMKVTYNACIMLKHNLWEES
jgi:uncharacterized protein